MFIDKLITLFSQAALRLERMPGYTLLSMLGLVLSLSGTVIIARYLHQEWTIDSWMPHLDRTYMLMVQYTTGSKAGAMKYAFAGNVNNEASYVSPVEGQSGVECWTNFSLSWPQQITLPGGEGILEPIAVVDSSFTQLFPYRAVAGTLVLRTAQEAIVSEEFARRHFPDEDAVGQTLQMESTEGMVPHTIVGVFRRPAGKGSFCFHVAKYGSGPAMVSRAVRLSVVRLRDGYSAETYNAAQPAQQSSYHAFGSGDSIRFQLIPYRSGFRQYVSRYDADGPAVEPQSSAQYLWMLLGVGVLLFFVGLFNFLNLYAVMRHTREHEMRVRRIFGASKWNIFSMLYMENLLISAPAMLGVWIVIELTTPHMKDWFDIEQLTMPAFDMALSLGIMFLLPLVAGARPIRTTGPTPSLALVGKGGVTSALKRPMHYAPSLQGRAGGGSASFLFLFLQYFISISLVTVSLYMMRQLHMMMSTDPGYRTENLLAVRLVPTQNTMRNFKSTDEYIAFHKEEDRRNSLLRQRLLECPYLRDMCEDPSFVRGGGEINGLGLKFFKLNETTRRMFGLEVMEGRMLCDSLDDFHTQYHCMLNETALKRLGLKEWRGAKVQLPQRLWFGAHTDLNDNPPYEVVGILRDFHSGRLSGPQQAMIFCLESDVLDADKHPQFRMPERIVLDVEPGAEKKVVKHLRKMQQEVQGMDDLWYQWLDDEKADLYREDRRAARIFFTFALLAIAVTCLGVLGLMMFDVRRRYREIALRKVHGALFRDIALLLSRRFLIILGLAAAVSIPVSLIGLHKLIMRYYTIHATIAWWIPLVSLALVFLLSALKVE